MRRHSNFPLIVTPDQNGTKLYNVPQLPARYPTAAASLAVKLDSVTGSVKSAVTLTVALRTQQRTNAEILPVEPQRHKTRCSGQQRYSSVVENKPQGFNFYLFRFLLDKQWRKKNAFFQIIVTFLFSI